MVYDLFKDNCKIVEQDEVLNEKFDEELAVKEVCEVNSRKNGNGFICQMIRRSCDDCGKKLHVPESSVK